MSSSMPVTSNGARLCWGDRFVSTPVQLAAFLSTPLLLRYRRELRPFAWKSAVAVLVVGVAIQIESTVFWYSLEPFQMRTLEHPTFVVGLRARNIVASTLGKRGMGPDEPLDARRPVPFPYALVFPCMGAPHWSAASGVVENPTGDLGRYGSSARGSAIANCARVLSQRFRGALGN
jgi:hypothetical protein